MLKCYQRWNAGSRDNSASSTPLLTYHVVIWSIWFDYSVNYFLDQSISCLVYKMPKINVLFCPNPKVDRLMKLLWLIDKLLTMKFIINYYDKRLILLSHFLRNKCQNWPLGCEYFQFVKIQIIQNEFFYETKLNIFGFFIFWLLMDEQLTNYSKK